MRARSDILCLSILLFAAIAAHGQQTQKPLTNSEIVKLVQAEISDQTIVLVIEHSRTNFDISPDGLIALHKSRVSKLVIDAMLEGGSKTATSAANQGTAMTDLPRQNLSDEFARAGLKALKSIQGTLGTPSLSGGSIAVPRSVQDLIDDADANARTDDEKAVVGLLNKFFIGRLMNNLQREIIKPLSYSPESEAKAQKELEDNPQNRDMNIREAACSGTLDSIFRARHFSEKPSACDEVSSPRATKATQN
jgi:hypothetical protein